MRIFAFKFQLRTQSAIMDVSQAAEEAVNSTLYGVDLASIFTDFLEGNESANGSTNGTDELYEYTYDINMADLIPLEDMLPVTLTYSLTLLIGLIGNILVIFSILYYRRMRTTTNVFLLSLASADLLLVVLCVPIKVSRAP